MMPLLVAPFVVLAGLAAGSFVATAAIRFSRGEGFVSGRSRCDGCGSSLGLAATVPVFAYAARRGSATCCGTPIDPQHLIGELCGAGIALAGLATGDLLSGTLLAALGLTLLALALIDWRTQRLPDPLVAGVAIVLLLLAALRGSDSLITGVLAAATTFIVMEGVRRAFLKLRRRSGLGQGDVKLLTALAVGMGLMTPLAVAIASGLGLVQVLVMRPGDGRIAFGPAIAVAGFGVIVAQLIWGFSL